MNVKDIIYAIGRKKLAARVGVGETAISEAIVRGHFPSAWYPDIIELAKEADEGIEVPLGLFNWRNPVNDNHTAA